MISNYPTRLLPTYIVPFVPMYLVLITFLGPPEVKAILKHVYCIINFYK